MSKIIALDVGHGLNTPGKQTPDGIKEWTLNDKIRDKVVEKLERYDVSFLFPDNNEGNTDEGLTTRRAMYINGHANAAVSLHHNAFTGNWNDATGVEVWVDRNATDKDLELANIIYNKLVAYTGLKGRGVKRANFTVIYQNQIPAVLVEGGFMDSNIDYKVITSDQGQDAYARAVAEGLIEFCNLEKKTVQPAPQPTPAPQPAPVQNGYLVEIDCSVLNVRSGPGVNHKVNTTVKRKEVYTIVGEDNGWGKLKSGAGWIKLSYTKRLTSGTVPSNPVPAPQPVAKELKVGSKVKIKSSATKYCTGQNIPNWVKGKTYTVQQMFISKYPNGVLLKEITSWVDKSDLEY